MNTGGHETLGMHETQAPHESVALQEKDNSRRHR